MTLFFTADTHFGDHRTINIWRRPFANSADMDRAMIERWNAMDAPEDEVWHLGDVARAPAGVAGLLDRMQQFTRMLDRSVRVALMIAAALASTGCSNSAEVRYRVAVTVDDNGRSYSGSGVWSSRQIRPLIALDSAYGNEFHGDAVTVKLPGRGLFFLIPVGTPSALGNAAGLPEDLFAMGFSLEERGSGKVWSDEDANDRVGAFRRIARLTGQSRTSPCDYNVPDSNGYGDWKKYDLTCLMTAFTRNPADPHGVVSVPKGKSSEVIGKGVRIGRVAITITDDKVTRTIWNVLPWLADLPTPEERLASRYTIKDDVVQEVHWMRR